MLRSRDHIFRIFYVSWEGGEEEKLCWWRGIRERFLVWVEKKEKEFVTSFLSIGLSEGMKSLVLISFTPMTIVSGYPLWPSFSSIQCSKGRKRIFPVPWRFFFCEWHDFYILSLLLFRNFFWSHFFPHFPFYTLYDEVKKREVLSSRVLIFCRILWWVVPKDIF